MDYKNSISRFTKMKINHVIILLLTHLLISACNKQKAQQTVEVKKYIASLKAMKYDELKNQLKKDTALLNKLIKTATFQMQLTSHFSSGEKSAVDKSVSEFDINRDQTKITELFNDYCKQLYFDQSFIDEIEGVKRFSYESRFALTADNHVLEEKDVYLNPLKRI